MRLFTLTSFSNFLKLPEIRTQGWNYEEFSKNSSFLTVQLTIH